MGSQPAWVLTSNAGPDLPPHPNASPSAIVSSMNRRRARWLALSASSVIAALIFAAVWPWLKNRETESVRIQRLQRPEGSTAQRSGASGAASLDPATPQEWRYFLTEDEADSYFFVRSNNRMVFDPWTYMRDAGNLDEMIPRREHPAGKYRWQSNSLGCREDHELDDPPRDWRVLVAGDSHTCGLCNDEESFANLLEAGLAREYAGKSVEVLNAALGGYSFYNYFGTLLRLRSFKPQLFVIGVFGGNDFAELLPLEFQFKNRPWDTMSEREQERRAAAMEVSYAAMGQGLNSIDTFRAWPHEEPLMVRSAIELCEQMRDVAQGYGTKLIVVFIPAPFDFKWDKLPQRALDARAALELTDEDMAINRRMGTSFLEGLRAAGLPVLDMRPIFEREATPPYWRVDFHINLRGQELIAEALKPLVSAALEGR